MATPAVVCGTYTKQVPCLTADSWTTSWTSRVMSTNCVRLLVLMRSVFMTNATSRNRNDEVGTGILKTGMPFDFLENRMAPARNKGQETKFARLQRFAGINQIGQKFLMSGHRSGLAIKRTADHLLELFGLVFNFVLS